jgi:magnesium transporter
MARTRAYRDGQLVDEGFPLQDLSEHLDTGCVVWADLVSPGNGELSLVSEELSLHDLAVEDAVERRQRPKLDRYGSHFFVTAYHVRFDPVAGRLELSPVSAFVSDRALVTVHDEDLDPALLTRRWDQSPELTAHGVAGLLYGLLDAVVDSHFEAVEGLDEEIEGLEDLLFAERPVNREVQQRSFQLRKSLVLLRRVSLPMREVVNALLRGDVPDLTDEMAPYFHDVYDHVLRVSEWTDSLRDLVATILETNLTIQGNQLNSIMKKVTSWAAIIAVPTAVTGFYGQNVPYPGYGHTPGFVMSTVLIVILSGALFAMFRSRDWI